MPLIYLQGGPWHHELRMVDELHPILMFHSPSKERYKLVGFLGPDIPIMQEKIETVSYMRIGTTLGGTPLYCHVIQATLVSEDDSYYRDTLMELLDKLESIFEHGLNDHHGPTDLMGEE